MLGKKGTENQGPDSDEVVDTWKKVVILSLVLLVVILARAYFY